MQTVVPAVGEGTRLRPLIEDKPQAFVKTDGKPILPHCFDRLAELGADEFVVVVGYLKQRIINHYDDEHDGVPITYTHQREQNGLAQALLTAEEIIYYFECWHVIPPTVNNLRYTLASYIKSYQRTQL